MSDNYEIFLLYNIAYECQSNIHILTSILKDQWFVRMLTMICTNIDGQTYLWKKKACTGGLHVFAMSKVD